MNPFKKLASQTAIYGLPTIVGRLLNYFLVPLYTYIFPPAEYGTVTEMYAYVSFLLIVLTYGMETALFNFSRLQEDKKKVYATILTCVTFTSLLFIASFTIFKEPIANLIHYPDHPEYITWFALMLGFDAISSITFAKLREQNQAKTFALIKTINVGVNIAFNLFFLIYCKQEYEASATSWIGSFYSPEIGVGYIFISNVLASAITLLVLIPSTLRIIFPLKGQVLDVSLLKQMLLYALPLLLAGLAGMTNETMDRILLKYLLPQDIALAQVGIYGACYKISIIMTIFWQTFRYAAEPFFFSNAKEQNAKRTYSVVMNYFVIICMIIFLATMANITWIKYFVDDRYWDGLPVVPILLLANFCVGVFFNLSIWYKLSGKTRYGAYLTILGATITLVGNFVFIPVYGYVASAWTTLICYTLMMGASYLWGNKYFPVEYDLKRFFGYVSLSLILYALIAFIALESNVINLVLKNMILLAFVAIVIVFERKNLAINRQ